MRTLTVLLPLCTALFLTSVAASAPPPTPEATKASIAAHRGDFDYLLGDWEIRGVRREPDGTIRFRGYWSALRLTEGGQILDEYRVVSDEGETFYVSTTLRAFNARRERWELVSADAGTGLQNLGTAQRVGSEMRVEQTFDATGPHPSTWRIRYHDIEADRFSWNGDRSLDGGKTWVKDFMTLEVHRIGPPRSMEPLTSAKRPADTAVH